MFKGKRITKGIAAFLLANFLQSIFLPVYSYALTAGPTAPEATSFEPVDTTDMVNLLTGDFNYTIPFLEVPGPSGGYPLSLSYHAGIQTNLDASWVGLGWSLNPGAINRVVNGYPDDHKQVANVARTYWEGGRTESFTVGVQVGFAKGVNAIAGATIANDTYRGRGYGSFIGLNRGNFEAKFGKSPYGGTTYSAGVNVGVQASVLSANAKAGFSSSGAYGSATGNLNIGPLGMNMSSGSSKPNFSVAGFSSSVHNARAGNVSSISSNIGGSIPTPVPGLSLMLSLDYQRYWIDESESVATNGALYFPNLEESSYNFLENKAFDTYDLPDIQNGLGFTVDHPDPEKTVGGSFPSYDSYSVSAQGLGGDVRPYHFRKDLYRQDKKDNNTVLVKTYLLDQVDQPVNFRFENDFSNRFEYEAGGFDLGSGLSYTFHNDIVTGENGSEGYRNNHLAGSKHIEWYTNRQILREDTSKDPFVRGFIDTNATGFERASNSQVGGYTITNQSGVNYHYSLPVYSYDEYMKSENTEYYKEKKGDTYNELKKPEKYAYTWLLTAVTGPDYVDVNLNGLADKGDFGYWVNFDYGKWTDNYQWRNPAEGFNRDIDRRFNNFSTGKKEIYYLDAIRTASHTALFIKELRVDGKGVSTTGKEKGSFLYNLPVSVLGLKEVLLLKNEELSNGLIKELKTLGKSYKYSFNYQEERTVCRPCGQHGTCCDEEKVDILAQATHYGANVLDVTDFEKENNLRDRSLRVVQLQTSNDLCPGTSNSLNNDKLYKEHPEKNRNGKYTLDGICFLGKGGAAVVPPLKFTYPKNKLYDKDAFDMWGFYKGGFKPELKNENLARLTTVASKDDVDTWSLGSITTPLGAKVEIKYESDEYNTPTLYKNNILTIESLTLQEDTQTFTINLYEPGIDLQEIEETLRKSAMEFLLAKPFSFDNKNIFSCSGFRLQGTKAAGRFYESFSINDDVEIIDIQPDAIEFRSPALFQKINDTYSTTYFDKCITQDGKTIYSTTVNVKNTFLVTGNIVVKGNVPTFGGGLRVKEVRITNPISENTNATFYEYENGTTSYEPIGMQFSEIPWGLIKDHSWQAEQERIEKAEKEYKKHLYNSFSNILTLAREIPGPGVMYEKVTVGEKRSYKDKEDVTLPHKSTYEFEVYKEGMVDVVERRRLARGAGGTTYDGQSYSGMVSRSLTLKNYSSRIGSLKSISLFDKEGELVSLTENHYLHDGLDGSLKQNMNPYEGKVKDEKTLNNQGFVQETFTSARIVRYEKDDLHPYPKEEGEKFSEEKGTYLLLGALSQRETFPSVLTGQTNTNFKTGITSTSENLAFDYYSGEVVKTLSKDSYGNSILAENVPAYKHYDVMGLKTDHIRNKHMLTQTGATYSYKVNPSDASKKEGLLSASAQTWSNTVRVLTEGAQTKIWRKEANYRWNGTAELEKDGTYPLAEGKTDFTQFDFWHGATNPGWQKTTEITLYDTYSHALEATDINNNYASTRMDRKQHKVLATAANASYAEIAFSGAEGYAGNIDSEGGVSRAEGSPTTGRSHTGEYSLLVGSGKKGFTYTLPSGKVNIGTKYRASVWVYMPGLSETETELQKIKLGYTINGVETTVSPELQKNKAKSWYLLNIDIEPNGRGDIEISCKNSSVRSVYFDDFRLHPLDASLTSYVYDQATDELSYILDGNNLYTHYEYDAAGRLIRISKERMNFDYGEGKESVRADHVMQEILYNYKEQ